MLLVCLSSFVFVCTVLYSVNGQTDHVMCLNLEFLRRDLFFQGRQFSQPFLFFTVMFSKWTKNDPVMCLNLEFFKRETVCFRGDNLSFHCFHCSVNGQNFPCICVLNVAFLSLDENNLYNKFLTRC